MPWGKQWTEGVEEEGGGRGEVKEMWVGMVRSVDRQEDWNPVRVGGLSGEVLGKVEESVSLWEVSPVSGFSGRGKEGYLNQEVMGGWGEGKGSVSLD